MCRGGRRWQFASFVAMRSEEQVVMSGRQDANIECIEYEGHRQRRNGTWLWMPTMWRDAETWLLCCIGLVMKRPGCMRSGRLVDKVVGECDELCKVEGW